MSNMLFILGERLAALIEKQEFICRGMLRMAVEDGAQQLNTMSFRDWETVLQGEALSRRLTNVGVEDSAKVVAALRQTLVEKQSLLTMSVR